MKCEECGGKDAREVKHIPLPNGHAGHISLMEWTKLCPRCIRELSTKLGALVEAQKKRSVVGIANHDLAKEVESDMQWRGNGGIA